MSGEEKSDGTSGRRPSPVHVRRRMLVAFGVLFVVLFLVVAIAEGIGDPSVPAGDAAYVENVPGDFANVTEAEVEHAIELAAAQRGEQKPPKPGTPKYEELKETAMNSVLEGVWIRGLADEWGIEVSEAEVAKELKKVKKESFASNKEFKDFLKESGFTPEDVNERVEIQIFSERIQQQLQDDAPQPSQREIENYYEAAKATQFTQQPSRDVRLIVNSDRTKAEEAGELLTNDNTGKNWKTVAKKYSEDPTTKENGGLRNGVQEGIEEEPLDADIFGVDEGQVIGPVKTKAGYTVFEVVNSTPESVQKLEAVKSQIEATLTRQVEEEYFTNFVSQFQVEWSQRTFCADGYVTERCANYKGSGHAKTAPEACYEANPKGGAPEACPAPVSQLVPALPGTVTPLEPKGKPLAQRPRPGSEAQEGTGELPAGAVPPPAE